MREKGRSPIQCGSRTFSIVFCVFDCFISSSQYSVLKVFISHAPLSKLISLDKCFRTCGFPIRLWMDFNTTVIFFFTYVLRLSSFAFVCLVVVAAVVVPVSFI